MDAHVIKALKVEQQSKELYDLMQTCKDLLKLSRTEMKKNYDAWDKYDQVYRGELVPDEQDRKAAKRGEPQKMIVPLTYQQVQTFVAFIYQLFTQREYFYELEGTGIEDARSAKVAMALLERDLNHNKFKSEKLTQFLMDVARYGIGIFKHSWVVEQRLIVEQIPDPKFVPNPAMPQVQPPMIKNVRPVTKYKGNKIINVNPYRFFPDPRLPITRFSEGQFVASEDEYSISDLAAKERMGEAAGCEFIPKFKSEDIDGRRLLWIQDSNDVTQADKDPQYVLISELQVRMNPAKTMIAEGVALDKDIDQDVLCLVWLGNDSRVVRLEVMTNDHDEFTYDLAQFTNDQMRFINFGLAELLGPLQDTITWFINARITSVRKVISNSLIVDPKFIEMSDLNDRKPIIRLRSMAAGTGVDRYIKQLEIQDVTTGHINDAGTLTEWSRQTTGINENLLGQFAAGRRSAREASNVANNAAARLILTGHGLWEGAIEPMGRKLISNLRQGLDEQTIVKVIGLANVQLDPQGTLGFLQVTKDDLTGNYDFTIFDGTQATQRFNTAATLQELLVAMSKQPNLVPVFGYDPKLLLDETLELRGIHNVQRFALTPERLQQLSLMAGGLQQPAPAPVPGRPGPTAPGNGA